MPRRAAERVQSAQSAAEHSGYSKNSNKKTPGGAQMVPFRPYAKKLLRILDFSPDLNKKTPGPMQKRTSGAFGAPGGKMPKVSLHRVGSSGVFLHRVGNSTILAPFRPYAKKLLGLLIWAKYLNKKLPTICKKTFARFAPFGPWQRFLH